MKAHAKWVRPSRPVPEIWVHDESPAVTEDSAMAKAPAGTTEDPAMVEEVGSEDITPVMEEIWTPPYHVPESTWSIPGPLDHAQTPHYTFCLLCEKWCSAGHLMSAGHSSAIQRWMQSGKPLLKIPPRFAEDEQVEMLIQSRHPTWSRRTILAAKQAILQMAYYRAQEGTFRGEIPPEMDENLKKVLEEVREHPHQPVLQPAVQPSPRQFCSHQCRCLRKRLHCRRLWKRPRWGYLCQYSRRCRLLRQRPRRTRGHQRRHRGSVQCTVPRRGKATE